MCTAHANMIPADLILLGSGNIKPAFFARPQKDNLNGVKSGERGGHVQSISQATLLKDLHH
jgi:hypothetical protein